MYSPPPPPLVITIIQAFLVGDPALVMSLLHTITIFSPADRRKIYPAAQQLMDYLTLVMTDALTVQSVIPEANVRGYLSFMNFPRACFARIYQHQDMFPRYMFQRGPIVDPEHVDIKMLKDFDQSTADLSNGDVIFNSFVVPFCLHYYERHKSPKLPKTHPANIIRIVNSMLY
jgi:hypothetical protein